MAGSLLGVDQIAKVNAAYAPLKAHLRGLLTADSSPYGLMRIHNLIEALDTTEIHAIFSSLPFLSPAEKRALVRAAIFDVNQGNVWEPIDAEQVSSPLVAETKNIMVESKPDVIFTPPRFILNVATTEAHQQPKQVPTPKPESHKALIQRQVEEHG